MVGRALAAVLAALIWATVVLVATPSGAAAGYTSCTFSSGTVRLYMATGRVVRLFAVDGRIEYADLGNNQLKGQCGSATVRNTQRVRITEEVAGTSRLQFDQQLQRFGPGKGWESSGINEIEVYLGTLEQVWLMGTQTRNRIVIGSGGVNFNGDGDVDLIGSRLRQIYVFLNDADDSVDARGGRGTGDQWMPGSASALRLVVYASGGDDVIYGTNAADVLDGNLGEDLIYGRGGRDELRGGSHDDFVHGGTGADLIDPGPWFDTVYGGAGDDRIEAYDNSADRISGGTGSDRASVDPEDAVTGVESVTVLPG
jgi:Ca2+-binding RTX toxin-like protein